MPKALGMGDVALADAMQRSPAASKRCHLPDASRLQPYFVLSFRNANILPAVFALHQDDHGSF
jgi:hypothetical protein